MKIKIHNNQLFSDFLYTYGEHLLNTNRNDVVYILVDEASVVFMSCIWPNNVCLSCEADAIPMDVKITFRRRRVIVANGGDENLWKERLKNTNVRFLPDLMSIILQDFGRWYQDYLQEKCEENKKLINKISTIQAE